jgi:hypothetical protein
LLHLVPLFQSDVAFPSSLPELGLADEVTPESQAEAFVRSLRYWAGVRGLSAIPARRSA